MPPGDLSLGGTVFFGFIDAGASITSITYFTTALDDIVAVDDLRFGVVPEPSSLILIGLGLVGLVFSHRKM